MTFESLLIKIKQDDNKLCKATYEDIKNSKISKIVNITRKIKSSKLGFVNAQMNL